MPSASTFTNLYQTGQNIHRTGIMHRLKDGTEGTITLVGAWQVTYKFIKCIPISDIVTLHNDINNNPQFTFFVTVYQ